MPALITLNRLWAAIVAGSFLALLVALGIQTARIEGFKIWPISVRGYKAANADLRKQLHDISTAKAEQRTTTSGNIVKAEAGRVKAEAVAKRIEGAVPPGNCATPKEILSA